MIFRYRRRTQNLNSQMLNRTQTFQTFKSSSRCADNPFIP